MPLDGSYNDLMERHGFIPADHAAPRFFPVAARNLYDEAGEILPGYKRIIREDDGRTLHVATDAYKLISNEEAFGAFEDALKASTLDLTDMRIGTDYAAQGARVFRQYLLPAHRVQVKPGVETALRLIMFNSYDGTLAFSGRAGAYNFVCANTSIAGHDMASFRMRHAAGIDVAKAITGLTEAAMAHVQEAERQKAWPDVPVADLQALEVFRAIPRATGLLVDHLAHSWLRARDNDPLQGGANLWCLWNVLTAWATHDPETGKVNAAPIRSEREVRVRQVQEAAAWKALLPA